MDYFNSKHFYNAQQFQQELSQKKIDKILFPETKVITKGDDFFKDVWKEIDQAKDYVWIQTYAMDSTFPAQLTLLKMIEALKRNVNCVLYVDDLTQNVDKKLLEEYTKLGGIFKSLNPTWRHIYRNVPSQEFFRRHHEKLVVIDNFSIIGTQNFQDCFASCKYGTFEFTDFNFLFKNQNLKVFREHFQSVADMYALKLHNKKTTQQIIDEYNQKYPDTTFNLTQYKFFKTHQPFLREIQAQILEMIEKSQEKITLIHPYYYPVKKFEKAIENALKRGVQVDLYTSAKRDQPVYHYLKNQSLTRNLTKHGCKVYEVNEKLLHMKAYQFDNKHYSIGSFNNDRWSWKMNNECNIQVNNDPLETQRLDVVIDKVKQESKIMEEYSPVGFQRFVKIKFWETFLYLSELIMSKNKYVSIEKYDYKNIYNAWDDSTNTDF